MAGYSDTRSDDALARKRLSKSFSPEQIAPVEQPQVNIADRLASTAAQRPQQAAILAARGSVAAGYQYDSISFEKLNADVERLAAGFQHYGLQPGQRMVLMVRPSIDFVALTFALFKAGAITILIDPGMGREHLLNCLEEVNPEGFVAIPIAHVARVLNRGRFPNARLNVTVGRRLFWRGPTIDQVRATTNPFQPVETKAEDPAAIIFTTGSTGPPKGVLYRHGNFDGQVDQIRDRYQIQPGEVDLAGFPLFGLFNSAMGVTTVIPDMDASRPASVDPRAYTQHIDDCRVTQSFASPAVWNVVSKHCESTGKRLPTLQRVLSAGAPVPVHVLQRLHKCIAADGIAYTPYGATESLPVASISSRQVIDETAAFTAKGAGTCVGKRYNGIEWRVIRIDDGPLGSISETQELPRGEIGELIVRGPVVTTEYVTRTEANALAKITDGDSFWHRMGDVGYLDDQDRFWFCGRKAHRVTAADGPMYTVCCEAIANEHPKIYRSALVGVGDPGQQEPVMICEPWPEHWPKTPRDQTTLLGEIRELLSNHSLTKNICSTCVLTHPSLPVDIRHNAKIFREKLAVWAEEQLSG